MKWWVGLTVVGGLMVGWMMFGTVTSEEMATILGLGFILAPVGAVGTLVAYGVQQTGKGKETPPGRPAALSGYESTEDIQRRVRDDLAKRRAG